MTPDAQAFIDAEIATLTQLARTPDAGAALAYGVDLVCIDDIDPRLVELDPNSAASMAQDLYHRLATPRGQLPDDPNYGYDLVGALHRAMTPSDRASIAGSASLELGKDDRVARADCTLTQDGDTFTLSAEITPEDDTIAPFALIVAVTDGATLLSTTLAP